MFYVIKNSGGGVRGFEEGVRMDTGEGGGGITFPGLTAKGANDIFKNILNIKHKPHFSLSQIYTWLNSLCPQIKSVNVRSYVLQNCQSLSRELPNTGYEQ